MSHAVTLWVPGLLNPLRLKEAHQNLTDLALPNLKRLLAKGDRFVAKPQSSFAQASYLFHQKSMLSPAPVMASVDINEVDNSVFWLRVDPVQMIADRDSLVLVPGSDLGITEQESKALLKAFNAHFAQDSVLLEYGSRTGWYLRMKQPVDLQTHLLESVAYQPVNERYPAGNAASYWRQLLNETQMLFYTHPVNESRREQGLPEINSVWVWGEGALSMKQITTRPTAKIWSENTYLKGLAKIAQAQQVAAPQSYQAWLNAQTAVDLNSVEVTHHLIRLDAIADSLDALQQSEWIEVLLRLESDWFKPLLQALKERQIDSLLLDFGNGFRYHLKPAHLKRFWRLNKPLDKR